MKSDLLFALFVIPGYLGDTIYSLKFPFNILKRVKF